MRLAGKELAVPSWQQAVTEDWLGQWAMNLMLINVSTRKIRRAVRLPESDVPAACWGWRVEVGGLAALRGAVSCARMRSGWRRTFRRHALRVTTSVRA
jgi:hypothetical protein